VKCIRGLLAVSFLLVAAHAWGQRCTVSTVPVQFGQYDFLHGSPVDAIGSFIVNCSTGTPFTVKLGTGNNASTGFHPRRMRSAMGGNPLNYNLFRDSTRTSVWGDSTDNTFVQTGVGNDRDVILPVYGQLPGGQNVAPGLYRDSVSVTIEW
jgi:spore coat protein U domain-containing protein, fimbrial subunit CupE1/2/3/6